MRERDIEFGKLAIARGLASQKTVSDCFKALVPDASLKDELIRRGVLTAEQARALEPPKALEPPAAPGGLPEPGTVVGDYRVVSLLGKGGMGAVFKGVHARTGAEAAIKVMLAEGDDAETFLARFRREAEAMAKVDRHAGIVRIRASGTHGPRGLPFAVMDFVKGRDLVKEVRAGPLPLARALDVVAKVARAIHHCHEQGVLHRDLKPANVLIREEDEEPLLTDFGLARDEKLEALTKTGEVLGTPAYMAPEQAEGQSKEQDRRTDVYGLGAVLYECLVGEPPFKASSPMGLVKKVLLEDPVDPCRRRKELPPEAGVIALKCLAKEKENRYQTALAVAEELERLARGEPIIARPIGRREAARRWIARRPGVKRGIAGAALAFLATGIYIVATTIQDNAKRRDLRARTAATIAVLASWGYAPGPGAPGRAAADAALARFREDDVEKKGFRKDDPDAARAFLVHSYWDEPARALEEEACEAEEAAAALVLVSNDATRAHALAKVKLYLEQHPNATFARVLLELRTGPRRHARYASLLAAKEAPWLPALRVAAGESMASLLADPASTVSELRVLASSLARTWAADPPTAAHVAAAVAAATSGALVRFTEERRAGVASDAALELARALRVAAPGEALDVQLHALRHAETARIAGFVEEATRRGDATLMKNGLAMLWPVADLTGDADPEVLELIVAILTETAVRRADEAGSREMLLQSYALAMRHGQDSIDNVMTFTPTRHEQKTIDAFFCGGRSPDELSERQRAVLGLASVGALIFGLHFEAENLARWSEARAAARERGLAERLAAALRALDGPAFADVPLLRERLRAIATYQRAVGLVRGFLPIDERTPIHARADEDIPTLDAAIAAIREAQRLGHPRWIETGKALQHRLLMRADAHAKAGHRDRALADCAEAVSLSPGMRSRYEESRQEQARLVALDAPGPSDRQKIAALRLGGEMQVSSDFTIKALTYWMEAWAHEIAGRLGDDPAGRRALRRRALENGLDCNPDANEKRWAYALILEEQGELESALSHAERSLQFPPGMPPTPGSHIAVALRDRLREKLGKKP